MASRRRIAGIFLASMIACLLAPATTPAQEDDRVQSEAERKREYEALARDVEHLRQQARVLKRVIRIVRPAVVHIEVDRSASSRYSFSREGVDETGSGVIVRIKGKFYTLTNHHLIRDAEPKNITIRLFDGRELKPQKTWSDPETDVAVMSVTGERLVAARIGDSDRAEMGDFVLAVGSPFGLAQSVTFGIISAKGRRDLELATDSVTYQDFLQTDASINPGNSGGPLVNLQAELIGINTAIASSTGRNEGIGFSIPIKMVVFVAEQLVERGSVVRGFLGVNLDARFAAAAAAKVGLDRPRGAMVTSVTSGSPAETAKIKVGDVILKFGNTWIEDDGHLVNKVGMTKIGIDVPIVVWRDRKRVQLTVKIGDRGKFRRPK